MCRGRHHSGRERRTETHPLHLVQTGYRASRRRRNLVDLHLGMFLIREEEIAGGDARDARIIAERERGRA